jgi:hypothetical protein
MMEQLREAGAEVVGVSGDEVASHRLFKDTYKPASCVDFAAERVWRIILPT